MDAYLVMRMMSDAMVVVVVVVGDTVVVVVIVGDAVMAGAISGYHGLTLRIVYAVYIGPRLSGWWEQTLLDLQDGFENSAVAKRRRTNEVPHALLTVTLVSSGSDDFIVCR